MLPSAFDKATNGGRERGGTVFLQKASWATVMARVWGPGSIERWTIRSIGVARSGVVRNTGTTLARNPGAGGAGAGGLGAGGA
jgi:hypothetical protein